MKKAAFAMGISALLVLGNVTSASAHGRRSYTPAKNYLTFSSVFSPSQLGYKHHLGKNLYATGDMLFKDEQNKLGVSAEGGGVGKWGNLWFVKNFQTPPIGRQRSSQMRKGEHRSASCCPTI